MKFEENVEGNKTRNYNNYLLIREYHIASLLVISFFFFLITMKIIKLFINMIRGGHKGV